MLADLISGTQTTKISNQPIDTNGKKSTSEDNRNVLHCYLKSTPTQKGYRERIVEIWKEHTRFNTINKRIANQARMILKVDFLILRYQKYVNREKYGQVP